MGKGTSYLKLLLINPKASIKPSNKKARELLEPTIGA